MGQAMPTVPTDMQKVYQRFEHWRRSRPGKLPIPETLWAAAVKMAQAHGVCRTAQVLHLEHSKLKRLTESTGVTGGHTSRRLPAPAFMELVAPQSTAAAECLIELEGPRGKLRVQWKGANAPDLAALSRVLWESA
jgi:hypothetical protein